MSFNDLPPEVHILVCQHACHDTLKSLTQTSTYLHDIAQPELYRTVSLPTRRRVISFQHTLFRKPELATYVRHLLMSDRNRDEFHVVLPDFIVYWPQTHSERIVRRQRIRDWLIERDKELAFFRSSLRHILALVAPTLETLALLHYEHSIRTLRDLLVFSYPKLKELTIRGDYPTLPRNLDLPSLERLHLAAGDMPNPWASFTSIADGCPRLTHLRISEPLSCILSGVVLANAFEVAFGFSDYDPEALAMPTERLPDGTMQIAPRPRLPENLQFLLLQPYPPEMSAMGMPYPDHIDMMDRLVALEAQSTVFRLLPANNESYSLPYSFDAAYVHWCDRMDGGPGCWNYPKEQRNV